MKTILLVLTLALFLALAWLSENAECVAVKFGYLNPVALDARGMVYDIFVGRYRLFADVPQALLTRCPF